MNDKEELKQIYDIFTDCWRLYKKLYPPGRPEDDVYWQGVVKEIDYHCNWWNHRKRAGCKGKGAAEKDKKVY